MITIPLDAHQCSCGHPFDHEDTGKTLTSEEIRVQAEELYASYLAARVEQATSALMSAQADYARDPGNQQKSDTVGSALDEADAARAALVAQSTRIAEMKKALPPTAARAVPIKAPIVPIKPAAQSGSMALSPVRHTRKTNPVIAAVAAAAPVASKRKMKSPAQAEIKKPLAPLPSRVAVPEKPVAAQPAQTTSPNPAFREAQAAKARKILSAIHATKSEPTPKQEKSSAVPAVVKDISPNFAIPANSKEAPRLYVETKKKDCPNCTARVSRDDSRCRCGYEFSCSEQHIPAASISDEERAEFAKLFNYP
jgi:hypothetical protein